MNNGMIFEFLWLTALAIDWLNQNSLSISFFGLSFPFVDNFEILQVFVVLFNLFDYLDTLFFLYNWNLIIRYFKDFFLLRNDLLYLFLLNNNNWINFS